MVVLDSVTRVSLLFLPLLRILESNSPTATMCHQSVVNKLDIFPVLLSIPPDKPDPMVATRDAIRLDILFSLGLADPGDRRLGGCLG
ncbi:hypothetical protein BU24DRAFT_417380 [Aaosphaeria arxii CBS 175.79]|uniref:Secreted protein n=1 Tax=Aaosphaeria arxii CBS 175.79 TaxID=1450172 RepID=A0A6A5Y932_9PLEO|nr:uncharacterized protein BU24DRAFT_417380 [Aaosphaeria arxii CBS 175.79]KAF2021756.1 hypothetical protein BU24DRAFT_417380 [Aaosphaeria arxii CBS 175.79]